MFDLYIRVSKLGERSEGEATEVYEAQCRAWADRAGVAIDEVAEEMEVSGATAVAERRLERLLQRVEAGESEGIITPYLDRFGRDLIEGALAYLRRTRSNFQAAVERAAARGVYLAAKPPFGYRKDEQGRLVVDERRAALVVELYERRAAGANVGQLTRFLQGEGVEITKSGVRSILRNRAYLGEMRLQNGRKGEPSVLK